MRFPRMPKSSAAWPRHYGLRPLQVLLISLLALLNGAAESFFFLALGGLFSDSKAISILHLSLAATTPIVVSALVVKFALALVLSLLLVDSSTTSAFQLRATLLEQFFNSRPSNREQALVNGLHEAVTSFTHKSIAASTAYVNAVSNSAIISALLIVTMILDFRLVLLVSGIGLLLILTMQPIFRRLKLSSELAALALTQYSSFFSSMAPSYEEIRLNAQSSWIEEKSAQMSTSEKRLVVRSTRFAALTSPVMMNVALALVVYFIASKSGAKDDSLFQSGIILVLLLRAISFSQSLQQAYSQLRLNEPFSREIIALTKLLEIENSAEPFQQVVTNPVGITVERLRILRQTSPSSGRDVDYEGRPIAVTQPVSFSVASGEVICLTGASGSGKTSILEAVAGLVDYDGHIITRANGLEVDLRYFNGIIGYIAQEPQFANGTVLEALLGRNIGVPEFVVDSSKYDFDKLVVDPFHFLMSVKRDSIKDVHVLPILFSSLFPEVKSSKMYEAFLAQNLGLLQEELSGGQVRRVAILRSIISGAQTLIADEPFNGLDEQATERLVKVLHWYQQLGNSVLLSTHHLGILSDFENCRVIKIHAR